MAQNVVILRHFENPKEEGTFYRLICLTGNNKGESYILKSNRIVMGRGDNVDIKVIDIKSSREHAEITKVGSDYFITDLGSQNGILVNEEKVTQAKIKEGDRVVIGQTVYRLSKIEGKPVSQVKNDKFTEDNIDRPGTPGKKSSNILIVVLVIGIAFMLLGDGGEDKKIETTKTRGNVQDISDDIVNVLKKKKFEEDKNLKIKLNSIFQRGLREYREKNYFRAISEFNLALILNPNDPLADFYLRKTKEELDKVITDYFIKAKRDEESLKYQSAIISYCAVIRLLGQYEADQRFKDAEDNIKKLEGLLGLEPGEASCLKKQSSDQ